ncbi:hypothetical protein M0Q28_06405, partial [Patescibacteria group bacterium]|nr:hypothetical protein [Patescibacteria group bacterium]
MNLRQTFRVSKNPLLGTLALLITASILAFSLFVFEVKPASAAVPSTIGYQGRLKNSSGVAQTGTFSFTFRLYNASSGGTVMWTEVQSIAVTDGFVVAQLGAVTPFPSTIDFNQPMFFTVEVGSDGEMTPRVPINSVPYAYTAGGVTALSDVSAASATGGRMFYDTTNGALNYYDGVAGVWRNLRQGTVTSTFQQITDAGNVTTNAIQFAGGTSTDVFSFTTSVSVGGALTVGGSAVCLANGSDCPAFVAAETDTLASVTARGSFSTTTLQLYGGFVGSSSTVTSTFTVLGNTTLNTLTASSGTISSLNSNSALIGSVTSTVWLGFQNASGSTLNASAVFVNGSAVCLASGTNCPSGTTPNLQTVTNTGNTTTNAIVFGGGTSTGDFVVSSTFTVLGGTNLQSVTATNATATNLYVSGQTSTTQLYANSATFGTLTIGGESICLSNGTDCPAYLLAETDTLASVTARGSFSTTTLQLFGGFVGASSTVTSTLTVLGNTTLNTLTASSGTISSLNSNSALIGSVTSTVWLGFQNASGSTLNASAVFVNGSAVCLANGTNCLVQSSQNTSTLADVSARGSFATSTLQLYGGFVGSSSTVTSTFTVLGDTSLQNLTGTNATFTNATATSLFVSGQTSTTQLNANNGTFGTLTIGGQMVCLTNGTNCPAYLLAETDTLASVTARGSFSTTTLQLFGGFVGSSSTVTSTFTVLGSTSLQNLTGANATFTSATTTNIFGTNGTFTNLLATTGTVNTLNSNSALIGSVTSTVWLGFQNASGSTLNASAVFVNGSAVCLTNGTNCLVQSSQNTSTLAEVTARGSFSTTTLQLYGGFIGASSTVTSTLTVLGDTSLQNVTAGNATLTNATATNLFVSGQTSTTQLNANSGTFGTLTIGGQTVCLTNGTNCPAYLLAETDTLASVTARGSFSTTTLQLFGGFVGASSTVTSTFTVLGNTTLGAFTATSGTVSSLNANSATIGSVTSTVWLGFSNASGSTLNASAVFVNGSAVCLTNGTNCLVQSAANTSTLAEVSARGSFTTTTLQLYGGFVGSSSTVTSTLTVLGDTSLQNLTGTNATFTNVTATTLFATGVTASSGTFTDLLSTNLSTTNATSIWIGATTVSTTNLFVNGALVCLQNGTNCPATVETDTLATVTARGSFATSTLLLYGGFVGASSTVTSTLTVLGMANLSALNVTGTSALQAVTFTNATGSNVTTTNLAVMGVASATQLYVSGQLVCLASGTNCPSGTTPNLQTVTNAGNTTTNAIVFGGGTSTEAFTVSSTFLVLGSTSLQTLTSTNATFTSVTSTNLFASSAIFTSVAASTGTINTLNANSATIGSVTSTVWLGFSNASGSTLNASAVFVNGNAVCLANGTNCLVQSAANTSTLAEVSARGSFTTTTLQLYGGFVGASSTVTSTLTVLGDTSLQNLTGTNATFTNATTTNLFVSGQTSTTQLNVNSGTFGTLTIGGQTVCLTNGTNCPAYLLAETDTLASVTARGSFSTTTLQLFGGFVGSSSTVTSTFTVLGSTSLQNLTGTNATFTSVTSTNLFGTNGTFTNLLATTGTVNTLNANSAVLGSVTSTVWLGFSNASGSTLNASAVFVNGSAVCLANGTNCLVQSAANTSTLAEVSARGSFTTTTLQLYGGFVGASSTVTSTLTVLGGTALQNVTATNATATNLFVSGQTSTTQLNANNGTFGTLTIGGQTVCLTNGTNCPAYLLAEADTLASVTARGSFSTTTLQLFGGFVGASSTVTSTFTVLGSTSLQNLTGANATFTSVTTTNIFGTNGTFTNLLATTGTINTLNANSATIGSVTSTVWLGFSNASGSTLNASAVFVNGSAVCLANGSNCLVQSAANTSTLAEVSARGSFTTTTLQLYGGFVGASSTVTSTLTVLGDTSLQNLTGTNATFTNATATNLFVSGQTSTTQLNANNGAFGTLTIGGQTVCLTNGTNCPAYLLAETDTLASVTARGSFSTTTLQLFGGFVGASSTVTSTFTVLGSTSLQNLTGTNATFTSVTSTNLFGTNGTFTNLLATTGTINTLNANSATIGSVTSTVWLGFSNASGSTLNASAVFVNGSAVCLANGSNCPSGTTPNLQTVTNTGNTTTNAIVFGGGTSTGDFVVSSTLTVLGGTNLQSVTATNATTTNLFVSGQASTTQLNANNGTFGTLTIGGQTVCLTNGTNCPAYLLAETDTLASVTARGSFSTTTLQLFGGFVGASSTVTSTFTVLGSTSLQNLTGANATFTAVTSTNIFGTNGSFTNLLATTGTINALNANSATIGSV